MTDLVSVARRLRTVRQASRRFLTLHALEQAAKPRGRSGTLVQRALCDPMNHDWSLLYRGSVLDD